MKLKLAILVADLTTIAMKLPVVIVAYVLSPALAYMLVGTYLINVVTELYIQKQLIENYKNTMTDMLNQYKDQTVSEESTERRGQLDN